jgi:hypothetical protein
VSKQPAQVASPFSPFRGAGLGSQQPQLGQGKETLYTKLALMLHLDDLSKGQ